jgi:hypothetical protein
MESEIASREFRIDLFPRNNPRSDGAIATFVGNHLLVELTDAMKPDDAIPIMMHELLTHALYELAPLRLHQELIRNFVAASEPQSEALYGILNEGIATGCKLLSGAALKKRTRTSIATLSSRGSDALCLSSLRRPWKTVLLCFMDSSNPISEPVPPS